MKLAVVLCGLFSFSLFTIDDSCMPTNDQKVRAIFDAYEGELYFFTDHHTKEPLTLRVKEPKVVEAYGLPEAQQIGETFEIDILKEKEGLYIKSLKKL